MFPRRYVASTAEKAGPYLRICVVVIYPLLTLFFRRRWIHAERIPTQGPAILVANHVSYVDPLLMSRLVWERGRVPRFLAKESLFHIPLVGLFIDRTGQIPVRRGTVDAAQALSGAVAALEAGQMVIIYPEGTVTRDPQFWPMAAKTGVARLAMLVPDVPVIPMGQWGAQEFLDFYAGKFRPFPRKRATISVGEPMDLGADRFAEPTSRLLHAMTDRIMATVRDEVASIRQEQAPETFFQPPRRSGQPQ